MNRYAWILLLVLRASCAHGASLAFTSSSNPAIFGESVTLTASLVPASATGKVTFYDGTGILGIAQITAGIAALKTTGAAFGHSTLKAYYSGDAENAAVWAPAVSETVVAISDAGFPTFNPNLTPSNVNFIATADFNGDGNLDVVLTMVDQAIILLGKGDGTFLEGQPFSAGNVTSVTAVAVGDFNGDGVPDLAIADYGGFVWILLGSGGGTFGAPVSFRVDCSPLGVQVTDVNLDGIADLVAVGTPLGAPIGTTDISVLIGNGDGTFRSPVDYATANASQGAVALVIADFNGDQIPDLAVLDTSLSVLLGNGDGTFHPAIAATTGNAPTGLATGDFNGDGIPDLVVANNNDGTVSILLGEGNGQFQTQAAYPVQVLNAPNAYPTSVTVGDFNGDNIPDVAVADYEDGVHSLISILFGTGSGALQTAITYPAGAGAQILVQGDFNNDGAIDLSVADGDGSNANGDVGVLLATRCYFAISAPPLNFDATGGTTFISIESTEPQCGWSAAVNPEGWAFLSEGSGFGGGETSAMISANTTGVQRTGAVTVSGQPLALTQWSTVTVFADVTTADYDFDAVNLLYGKQITAGCSADDYCPATSITRAQMAIFIVRAVYGGSDNFPYSPNAYFGDVGPSDFGFKWIQHMSELGITAGCGGGNFCPNAPVTRAQMAVFLIRARYGAHTLFTFSAEPYFADAPIGSFAYEWIQRLREDNITAGCSPVDYCPGNAVSRGDMAIFVMRGAFNELLPAGQPAIASITPATLAQGSIGTFTVTAGNTNFVQGQTTMVALGGVSASALVVTSSTSFTVTLTASSDAALQPESVYVQTGLEEAVLPNALLVQ